MSLFNRPLSSYFAELRTGLVLLLIMAVIRFLAKPVFGLEYDQATHFLSMAWLLLILVTVYAIATARRGGNWKDYLANAFVLSLTCQILIALAIVVDELLQIDTFFTDPAHGGSLNMWVHIFGHLVPATIIPSVLGLFWGWLCGSLARLVSKPA